MAFAASFRVIRLLDPKMPRDGDDDEFETPSSLQTARLLNVVSYCVAGMYFFTSLSDVHSSETEARRTDRPLLRLLQPSTFLLCFARVVV